MKETEMRIAALFGGKIPEISYSAKYNGWLVELPPASPADQFLILQTARGKPRIFKTPDPAIKLCQRLGLNALVLAREPANE